MGDSAAQARKKRNKARRQQLEERKKLAYRRREGLGPDVDEVPLASSTRRFFALIIDQIFYGLCSIFFLIALINFITSDERVFGDASQQNAPPLFIFFLPQIIFGLVYIVPKIKYRGQTVGRRNLRIVVINEDGTGLLSWKQSLTRWFTVFGAPAVLAIIFSLVWDNKMYQFIVGIIYLVLPVIVMAPAIWSEKHQGFHDKLAGSVVIRDNPLISNKK